MNSLSFLFLFTVCAYGLPWRTNATANGTAAVTAAPFQNATFSLAPLSTAALNATFSSTAATPSSNVSAYAGQGTYYQPSADACGSASTAQENVVALSQALYDSAAYCGKYINVEYQGASVQAKVVDACESCGYYDLDFSPAAFGALANLSV